MVPADPPTPEISDQENTVRSIQVMERILENSLDPEYDATPEQLCDLSQMFLAVMFLRKVKPEWWFEHSKLAFDLSALCQRVDSEAKLLNTEGVGEKALATMKAALDISVNEITAMRKLLLKDVGLLRECPLPGVTTN